MVAENASITTAGAHKYHNRIIIQHSFILYLPKRGRYLLLRKQSKLTKMANADAGELLAIQSPCGCRCVSMT